ncbi:MAG: cytochrome c biogenesis protein CcdA [Actinobacteria bacterium]|jgi:cytochrome c-type biogenesis protein|nr:cytochrome c biogenesis protein CcdA [Actinomycetota bacterium]NCV42157.1 cytochrome c biogenesis protein CcdA [Actinomycetota bacterium]NCW72353.1 cytochrome c biogenesis protein CcdA [Actinomycetota bacterium]NCX16432.1 cytochrome c biogenesis protein CcdA [Actinomycetota bacterium]NCX37301.1 cytochrome c biogenesis protein CcdA [Actinomycetota bacterium]
MKDFFVEQIMSGFLITALPVAFIAGVISFLSPCILPLVPGYLSFAAGFSASRGKVFLGSVLFVLGFSFVFVSFGAIFGGLGNQLVANEAIISIILGLITIFLGFIFLGKFPFAPTFRPTMKTTGGLIGAPILGFLFGVGWTPCIGPALAAVQTLAFQESSALRGALLSLGYCLGLGLPFIASGVFLDRSEKLRKYLVKRGDLITKIGGVFLITLGLLQVTGLWGQLMNSMRSLISDFIPVV